ncbi:cobalt ABC transporter permease [Roseospira marina]|uniref:cobalt ABC transporter permease n=1 Tax=Roseospira marina TaxID=140057 RepID=UPI001478FCA3|nr:cobalt ABC transporter permease [Roseospira marina]MBB4313314.1 nickel transport protein [Roseospira marina]MBB5085945.1 nickel transport protein [Roseospira marina]
MIRAACLALGLMALTAAPALAHKVVAAAYPAGDMIEGEVGFSNGDMAADAVVEVFDENGTKMGEARTDADGFFTYTPTQTVTHVFRADLGAGHVAQFTLDAADMPAPASGGAAPSADTSGGATTGLPPAELTALIATAVRDEMRPLRREISAYKEKNDLQTILGGIGYIVGLFGLAFFLMARRRDARGGPATPAE